MSKAPLPGEFEGAESPQRNKSAFPYLAGPLFSRADRVYNEQIGSALEQAGYRVVMPFTLLTDEDIKAAGEGAPGLIFGTFLKHLSMADCVVAVLDGPQVDDGTAWEIGYAYGQDKKIFGIRTDGRRAGETAHSIINSMIQGCIEEIAKDLPVLLRMLKNLRLSSAGMSICDSCVQIFGDFLPQHNSF